MLCIHDSIRHQYAAQCCASCINNSSIWLTNLNHASKLWLSLVYPGSMLYIHGSLHQASVWLMLCIRHQYGSMLYIMASIITQCCASGINVAVHHSSIYNYGLMLCIHGSMTCIRQQHVLMLCIRHQCGSIWLNTVHQASLWHNIWLNAVQTLIYGSMRIRHHNAAQTHAL